MATITMVNDFRNVIIYFRSNSEKLLYIKDVLNFIFVLNVFVVFFFFFTFPIM